MMFHICASLGTGLDHYLVRVLNSHQDQLQFSEPRFNEGVVDHLFVLLLANGCVDVSFV